MEWLRAVTGHSRTDDVHKRKLAPYLEDAGACSVLRLILENPGITAESLAARAHMDSATVAGYLQRLSGDGIIIAESGYHIAVGAKAAVVERLPLNYQCPGMLREEK